MAGLLDLQFYGSDIIIPPGFEHVIEDEDPELHGSGFNFGKFLKKKAKKYATQDNLDRALGFASQAAAMSGDPRLEAAAAAANTVNSSQKTIRGAGLSIAGRGAPKRRTQLAQMLEAM